MSRARRRCSWPVEDFVGPKARKGGKAKTCECECGEEVTSRFRPGHDQRLAGQLIRKALAGGRSGTATRRRITALGWDGKLAKSEAKMAKGQAMMS
jgi:hypothetical protein